MKWNAHTRGNTARSRRTRDEVRFIYIRTGTRIYTAGGVYRFADFNENGREAAIYLPVITAACRGEKYN